MKFYVFRMFHKSSPDWKMGCLLQCLIRQKCTISALSFKHYNCYLPWAIKIIRVSDPLEQMIFKINTNGVSLVLYTCIIEAPL